MANNDSATIHPNDLEAFCVAALSKAGLSEEDAKLTAKVFVTTDTWGTFTHGSRQIRGLLKNARSGRLKLEAREKIVTEGPAWAIIDACDGMPPSISYRAVELAIRKARETGMAYVGIRGSSHYGAAGFYANMIAEHGMLGLSMCNVEPCMTVPGGKAKMLGTNPIAYAAPTGTEHTVMLDIATSAVAATKIFAARNEGRSIPDTWLVDENGVPTTDPNHYPEKGAQLPMAGHKGYGLAVLVEILTAVMTGSAMMSQVQSWASDLPEPSNQGHAFLAIDVSAMLPPADFNSRMADMRQELLSAPTAEGTDRIYMPGEMEWDRRDKAVVNGMELPEDVLISLRGLAEDLEIDPGDYNLNLGAG
jgi:ureidoglycolate dehydrogenase (NAD+)